MKLVVASFWMVLVGTVHRVCTVRTREIVREGESEKR